MGGDATGLTGAMSVSQEFQALDKQRMFKAIGVISVTMIYVSIALSTMTNYLNEDNF